MYDRQFTDDTEFLMQFYKTLRAYYICLFYLINKKYKEAISFCFRVETYLKQLNTDLQRLKKSQPTSDLTKEKLSYVESQLKQLTDDLNQSRYKIQTASILDENADESIANKESQPVNKEKLEKVPLSERLDIYFEDNNLLTNNPNILKLPLGYEPIPCKPLFFDLALNHVELPSLDDKIDSKKSNQKQQQGAGVKGLIKGFFGFGS